MIIKWCHFVKITHGKICVEHYFPITEVNKYLLSLDKETMLAECAMWADNVDSVSYYKYEYEFVDTPTVEWMTNERKKIINRMEHDAMVLKEFNKLIK